MTSEDPEEIIRNELRERMIQDFRRSFDMRVGRPKERLYKALFSENFNVMKVQDSLSNTRVHCGTNFRKSPHCDSFRTENSKTPLNLTLRSCLQNKKNQFLATSKPVIKPRIIPMQKKIYQINQKLKDITKQSS